MDYFAGLDVSVKETSVCIVDDAVKIVREARVASEPEALLQVLTNTIYRFKRVGLEAGPLSQWLETVRMRPGEIELRTRGWKKCVTLLDSKSPIQGPWCRVRREARARERHRHWSGG